MKITSKYKPFPVIGIKDRRWPDQVLSKAPIWCSVDLRDGNQALKDPMNISQKIEMFELLVKCGFKEIEVGFPASSNTEFEFVRRLILENKIPDDVTIQVLTQAREELIKKTVESLIGAKRVIVHLYNSTSPAQRRVVFGLEKTEIIEMAVQGTKWVKKYVKKIDGSEIKESIGKSPVALKTEVIFQYSPESFSATEVDFAIEICGAVVKEWKPTVGKKMIINLPETVEVAMPNIYADQVEYFCKHLKNRESVIVSVHTHNDRGTGVAATELGLLAGAERVEGTLFGNGERTGNLDIVILALNMYSQGIDPMLDFSNIDDIRMVYEKCTGMTVPPRHPYSGELVFTAFSGSHQDAIRKGLSDWNIRIENSAANRTWDVPYLAIDPKDIGRKYDEVIRINGQSGKGGIAYTLENNSYIKMPKEMQKEFGSIAGNIIDSIGREVSSEEIYEMFQREYINRSGPCSLLNFHIEKTEESSSGSLENCENMYECSSTIVFEKKELKIVGWGNGPVDAFVKGLRSVGVCVNIFDFHEHSLTEGSEAKAIAYVCIQFADAIDKNKSKKSHIKYWGAGIDPSIDMASIKAIIGAINRR